MAERRQLPLIRLQGGGSRSCIIPGLMDHWKQLLDRRLAWIRHHRDNPNINPDVDTSKLITGVDGLPTCENLPPEPEAFRPIPYSEKDTNGIQMRLLFEPANRAWAREHVAPKHFIDNVTHILQHRAVATHFAWANLFDWLYMMDVHRVIKTLDLMERIIEARKIYVRDIEQLKHFAENPHTITQRRDSLCIQTMCRIIGLDVDDNFDWLYQQPFQHMQLKSRVDWIRNVILPAHEALASHKPERRAGIAVFVGDCVKSLQESDPNVRLYALLDHEMIEMMGEVRAGVPPL
ncbi:uncharacterized protein FFB20_09619 [Fusarium fujikuroi]|nr:uncharacterized protein LW93_4750 [Fusarium fujikuroi]SCN94129.1 uncharacterized protein FFB20_09619 [Fusarium fujikuroi]